MILLGEEIHLHIELPGGNLGRKWMFVLPPVYTVVRRNSVILFADRQDGLRIAASAALYPSGAWIHASCSRQNSMPTYYDLRDLKQMVLGDDRPAVQVFPVSSEHVNIHPFCLHLWGPLQPENWPLPDFTNGMGTI